MIYDDKIKDFTKQETKNLDWPHKNALVIEIMLTDCEITRLLINTASLVNVYSTKWNSLIFRSNDSSNL